MKFEFGKRSLKELRFVKPELILVSFRALQLTTVDFGIIEGIRTLEEQEEYIRTGASHLKDPNSSKHIPDKYGLVTAVDVGAFVAGKLRWEFNLYVEISKAFKQASEELSIPITWGGDWKSLKDGPHFELRGKKDV